MTTLILPVAGRSTRYTGVRPKWLMTLPDGRSMFDYSISGLDLSNVDRIVLIALNEHVKQFTNITYLQDMLSKYGKEVDIVQLDEPTRSQSETIVKGINAVGVSGPIYIKDCDNYFEDVVEYDNSVSFCDLHDYENIFAGNKSYVDLDGLNNVKNIAEKSIISPNFCCGGYQFNDASKFLETYSQLVSMDVGSEIYVSHIIYKLLAAGKVFYSSKAENFIDLGTLSDFKVNARKTLTVFCDVDGVLCENGSAFSSKGWGVSFLRENLCGIKSLCDKKNIYLVITTSRPDSERFALEKAFNEEGIYPDSFLMGLPHARRVLINDFSNSNQYPTAISINIKRDSGDLPSYLEQFYY